MYLSAVEEKALNGEFGESQETAYRILVAVGRLTNAERLIRITHAHLSGVSYLTIGEYGSEFLERFSRSARVKVTTTVNPCGLDIASKDHIGLKPDYVSKQMRIIESYRTMGVVNDSFTCIPYESFNLPSRGSHVAWAESSAAIYANSILGLRTNRESSLSALAAATSGKTPYSGLHLDRNRKPTSIIDVDKKMDLKGALDFGVLGYFAGAKTSGEVIGFKGIRKKRLEIEEAKALSAGIGTSGIAGMFTLVTSGAEGEKIEFSQDGYEETLASLSTIAEAEALIFGCPQLTIEGFRDLSNLFANRKMKQGISCIVFTSRRVLDKARRLGYPPSIEGAGARIFADSCADFSPLVGSLGVGTVATDSCKGAHYMARVHGLRVNVQGTDSLVQKYTVPK